MVEHEIENEAGVGLLPTPFGRACRCCPRDPRASNYHRLQPSSLQPLRERTSGWPEPDRCSPAARSGFYCGLIGGFGRINSPRLAPLTEGPSVVKP